MQIKMTKPDQVGLGDMQGVSSRAMRRTKTDFISIQTLVPPAVSPSLSRFHKSCKKQGNKKALHTHRSQNKAEANIVINYFFHWFSVANSYSGFCRGRNLSDSVRTAITSRAVGISHKACSPTLSFSESKLQFTGSQTAQFTQQ